MDDYFNREFTFLEKELVRLKTSAQKSAGSVKMLSKTVTVSVDLVFEDTGVLPRTRASAYYEVITDNDAIIIPTLDWYNGDITKAAAVGFTTRKITMATGILRSGNFGIKLYFTGSEGDANSDGERAKRGETITISVNLTVSASQDFTIRRFNP